MLQVVLWHLSHGYILQLLSMNEHASEILALGRSALAVNI
jgi:hypothetical protein